VNRVLLIASRETTGAVIARSFPVAGIALETLYSEHVISKML
jgi:hypothetical protein